MKRLIIDLDNTICTSAGNYSEATPHLSVINRIRHFKEQGFTIVIHTSRNMRTYEQSIGLINANTLPIIISWLDKHDVPYDEIIVGKPWCGNEGFYVDDRSIRPSEFVRLSDSEIQRLISEG